MRVLRSTCVVALAGALLALPAGAPHGTAPAAGTGPSGTREAGALRAVSADAGPGAVWRWPVGAPHPIARPYIAPVSPYAAGHRGIDVRSPDGVVRAPADGVVHFAGVVVDRPVLSIEHAGGLLSSYEPVETSLEAGDAVRAGEPIGTLVPGHCASPCLHFGVRAGGGYVSPLLLLGGLPWSVLLPLG